MQFFNLVVAPTLSLPAEIPLNAEGNERKAHIPHPASPDYARLRPAPHPASPERTRHRPNAPGIAAIPFCLLLLIVEQAMAETLEFGVFDLIAEFRAHA